MCIGVIGGSGFYKLLNGVEEFKVSTPYGQTSDEVSVGTYKNKKVVFIPRHGKSHSIPPHKINYRANLCALKSLGVKFIISPTAAGSLQEKIKPGSFVVVDQFVDRTKGRKDTFFDGPITTHISGEEPYCNCLRKVAINSIKKLNIKCHETGTVVVIQGPRFSTKAESKWFTNQGWEVINMTQYPEVVLARELEMCFVNVSLITDYDSGLEIENSSTQDIIKTFNANIDNIQMVVLDMIENIDVENVCECHHILESSRFND